MRIKSWRKIPWINFHLFISYDFICVTFGSNIQQDIFRPRSKICAYKEFFFLQNLVTKFEKFVTKMWTENDKAKHEAIIVGLLKFIQFLKKVKDKVSWDNLICFKKSLIEILPLPVVINNYNRVKKPFKMFLFYTFF